MTRLLLAAPLLLAACVEGMSTQTGAPRMDQAGTCFAFVTPEEGGTFTLTTGIGDGSKTPLGVQKTGLSAKEVDAAFAKERAIMDINPECLAISAKPRAETPAS
ncbi:hypothetical protein LPB142_13450 [Rhodobacter xanthinilyticus]|uniref:Lipoprotein n=1 Tax=Rhodobacter xanthinilyticus TaxID=1850250 RepID=A0A1D9MEI2_9RHOB|nr:hypothetical protein [Rhodobacter xanthinilyticus]AOZ70198.1 hypothetical protein LPB142_13450 [Rhodobacter xanthinilyticus]